MKGRSTLILDGFVKNALKYAIPLIIILCFISRFPQLLSDNLYLDGDECIVGLMSKHFMEMKEFPLFFYGQSYGFSFIEVVFIRLFYTLFGISDFAVKLAMLTLWTIGVVFFYKTLKEIGSKTNPYLALLMTIAFIFSPAFGVWSMKARGGYLTAFTLSSLLTYLILKKSTSTKPAVAFLIGCIAVFIYQSQVLWLIGVTPFLLFYFLKTRSYTNLLLFILGVCISMVCFYFLKQGLPTFWAPQILSLPKLNGKTLVFNLQRMYVSLTGSYHYNSIIKPSSATQFLAIFMMSSIFVSFIFSISLVFKKKFDLLKGVSCLSVLFLFGFIVFISSPNYRYLVPLAGFVFLMLYIQTKNLPSKILNTILVLYIIVGTFSFYSLKNYTHENKHALVSLVDELKSEQISSVYCEGALLQWQIMFYSKEKVIARFLNKEDRYPLYIQTVDKALIENKKIALVGFIKDKPLTNLSDYHFVNTTFFITKRINKELLIERGFEFN